MGNILFVGGAGFIGSYLIKTFVKYGWQKIIVYEPPMADISRICMYEKNVVLVRGALSDFDLLSSVIIDHDIQIVVHLASTLIPSSDYSAFLREFENVIFPTIRLISLCSIKKIKFVFFSSGGTIYGNNSNEKFKESENPSPISYYGLSKQFIEDSILFENRRSNLLYLIIRPSNPFGPGQLLNGEQGLIAVSIGKILSGEAIVVWGDGSSIRDYIFIEDLADIFFKLINNNIGNDTINIGIGEGYSVNDIICHLKNIAGSGINVKYENKRSVDVTKVVLDISKLHSYINIEHTPLAEGIRIFYNYALSRIKK